MERTEVSYIERAPRMCLAVQERVYTLVEECEMYVLLGILPGTESGHGHTLVGHPQATANTLQNTTSVPSIQK